MKNRPFCFVTNLLTTLIGGGFALLLQSPFVHSQIWKSDSLQISVLGHASPACKPLVGDAPNMERCSLKVRISRTNSPPIDTVLPWETVSVQDAVALDTRYILFMGKTQGAFHQFSIYSVASNSITYQQLAQKASLSPERAFVAYQSYQPPHGSQIPYVQIRVLPTRGPETDLLWKSRIVFDDRPTSPSHDSSGQQRGITLCSNELFWSKNERWIGFCTLNSSSDSQSLVLVPSHAGAEATLVKPIDTQSICRHMGQLSSERCTVFVERITIGTDSVDVQVRSTGSAGYKEERVSYPFASFRERPE